MAGFAGVCDLQLRRPGQAAANLTACLSAEESWHDPVQRGIVLADLALAQVLRGDVEAGCDALHRCIDLAAQTRRRVAAQRVSTVRLALEPWRVAPVVAAVDDHLLRALLC